ncbi:MAG: DUF4062 domain-containing protein [Bacteroidales bacterium]|nr:DUF4062 domain-containing protein [Bacteroidales bacterium]
MNTTNTGFAKQHRQLRVFISSTFNDMNTERDALVEQCFPKIRDLCKDRGVEFVPLDLRWGITENAAKQGRVFETCMREIDNSRPFFIGIIGNRYGWIPNDNDLGQFSDDLKKRYPWLESALQEKMSITEMEMQYAVLRNLDENINAAFYFRSNKMQVKEEFKHDVGTEDEISLKENKLQALKQKIRNQQKFPVKEYDNEKSLADIVLKDLEDFLNKEYPKNDKNFDDIMYIQQENILAERMQSLFSLDRYFDKGNEWTKNSSKKHLLITGYSSKGKSYLLATHIKWLREKQGAKVIYLDYPSVKVYEYEWTEYFNYIVDCLLDTIGVRSRKKSSNSRTFGCIFQGIWWFFKLFAYVLFILPLKLAFGKKRSSAYIADEISSKTMSWQEAVNNYSLKSFNLLNKRLKKIKNLPPLYVAFDNLDFLDSIQLQTIDVLKELYNVRFIYSTSIGTKAHTFITEVLKADIIQVNNLYKSQSREFITNYLKKYGKELDEDGVQRDKLVNSNIGGNPKLLSYILNLMVGFGSFEGLDAYIDELSTVKDEYHLYEILINNMLNIFKDDGDTVIIKCLSALALVKNGLTEDELIKMFDILPLHWANVRPYILNICNNHSDLYYLPSDKHRQIVKNIFNNSATISYIVSNYFEKTLLYFKNYTDKFGGFDGTSAVDDAEKLARQVAVLVPLYLETEQYDNLYLWATYMDADNYLQEAERITIWRTLYDNGYNMRNTQRVDISPYLKRTMLYDDNVKRVLQSDIESLYLRWLYIASFSHQTEDVKWLTEKLPKDYRNNENEEDLLLKAQKLFTAKKYNELIALNPKTNDNILQITLNSFLIIAFMELKRFDEAIDLTKKDFETLNSYVDYDFELKLNTYSVYVKVATTLQETSMVDSLLKIFEQEKDNMLRIGIDNQLSYTFLESLCYLYFYNKRYNDTLKVGEMLLQSAKSLKLPEQDALTIINSAKQSLSSYTER